MTMAVLQFLFFAGELAVRSGLAKTFVGTTLIALSTSLPELVTCWAAVRLGSIDMAIGIFSGAMRSIC
ncbi:MAG: hypothetical protein FJ295_11670 [Planctomycetes bacterium]|nr:hypothetical protein [Planctomycetota bacterium]